MCDELIGWFFCKVNLLLLPKIRNLSKKRMYLITFTLSLPYPRSHHIAFMKASHQQKKGPSLIISSTLTSLVSSQMCPDRSQKLFTLQKIAIRLLFVMFLDTRQDRWMFLMSFWWHNLTRETLRLWEFFSIIDMKRVCFASAAQHVVLAMSVDTH